MSSKATRQTDKLCQNRMDRFLIRKEDPLNAETSPSDKVRQTLQSIFRLQSFRGQQEEIIQSQLNGRDTFVLMPTGGGKSLTYQLPAVLTPGVSLVVSPLLALIQNQVEGLRKLGIEAASLNSTIKQSEKDKIFADLKQSVPKTKLLYVTPEMLAGDKFRAVAYNLHQRGQLARLVIDEAHCISEWGHDFRDDYRKLAYWKQTFPKLQVMALTATATLSVRKDVVQQLGLANNMNVDTFESSFDRPNLHYEVRFKSPETNDPFDDIVKLLKGIYANRSKRLKDSERNERAEGVCGIIYSSTRKSCDEIAERLRKVKVRAKSYHSGLTPKHRKEILESWTGTTANVTDEMITKATSKSTTIKSEKQNKKLSATSKKALEAPNEIIDIVVATISFGMGIDKRDVRFVIHWDLPKSMEGYYQESGRAGRDGKVSRCILYYSRIDRDRQTFLLGKQFQESMSEGSRTNNSVESFNALIRYCEDEDHCRHQLLLDYFTAPSTDSSSKMGPACGKRCDICKEPAKVKFRKNEGLRNISLSNVSSMTASNATGTLQGFQCARDMLVRANQNGMWLKDGTRVGTGPKRKIDKFSTDPDAEDTNDNMSGSEEAADTVFSGFTTASGKPLETYDRSYLFGKKQRKLESSTVPSKESTTSPISKTAFKYPLIEVNKQIQGITRQKRESYVGKLSLAIRSVLDAAVKVHPKRKTSFMSSSIDSIISEISCELEKRVYVSTSLGVIYDSNVGSKIRSIKSIASIEKVEMEMARWEDVENEHDISQMIKSLFL